MNTQAILACSASPKPMLDKETIVRWVGDVIESELEKPENEIDMVLVEKHKICLIKK